MEMDQKRIIEILLGLVLFVLLVLLVFLVIGISNSNETEVNVINSYNENSYNTQPANQMPSYMDGKPYYVDLNDGYAKMYYIRDSDVYQDPKYEYLRYYDWGTQKRVKGVFGNDIDRYEVYVQNREYVGGYFKVVYKFEDYYGKITTYPMTKYIGPGEEETFVFTDVTPSRYEYRSWSYELDSLSKTPTRVYYNN